MIFRAFVVTLTQNHSLERRTLNCVVDSEFEFKYLNICLNFELNILCSGFVDKYPLMGVFGDFFPLVPMQS